MRTWAYPVNQIEKQKNNPQAGQVTNAKRFTLCETRGRRVVQLTEHAYTFPIAVLVFADRAVELTRAGKSWALRPVN